MTGTSESNRRARENGERGEDEAVKLLNNHEKARDVERVNNLLDLIVDQTWIEVKTCQAQTVDHSIKNGRRGGRFVFNLRQHEALTRQGGMYMFIVLKDQELFKHRLMYARDIEFKNKLTWSKVIKNEIC